MKWLLVYMIVGGLYDGAVIKVKTFDSQDVCQEYKEWHSFNPASNEERVYRCIEVDFSDRMPNRTFKEE